MDRRASNMSLDRPLDRVFRVTAARADQIAVSNRFVAIFRFTP
jgi:hypothetical protein